MGDVINHGKHQFWGKPNVHYHQGMKAGENTLNAICARVVLRTIAANAGCVLELPSQQPPLACRAQLTLSQCPFRLLTCMPCVGLHAPAACMTPRSSSRPTCRS